MEPFIGEIRIFSGNFAPKDWAFCNGQLLPISANTALFAILGTQFGGDGRTTFGLPSLMGRAPMHQGNGAGLTPRSVGDMGGEMAVTVIRSEMPLHSHAAMANSANGTTTNPEGAVWAKSPGGRVPGPPIYTASPTAPMSVAALVPSGGNAPHNNAQPYLGMNFIIALNGIFPPHS